MACAIRSFVRNVVHARQMRDFRRIFDRTWSPKEKIARLRILSATITGHVRIIHLRCDMLLPWVEDVSIGL